MMSSNRLSLFFLCCHLKTLIIALLAMRNCGFVGEINKNRFKATGSQLAVRTVGWRGEENHAYLLTLGGSNLGSSKLLPRETAERVWSLGYRGSLPTDGQ